MQMEQISDRETVPIEAGCKIEDPEGQISILPSSSCCHCHADLEVSEAQARSRRSRLLTYLSAPIQVDFLVEIQLLLLTFSTGIQDAISFPDFRCFASNQTGNSVVLAVGIAGQTGNLFDLSNIGTSLALFISGAIITGQIAHVVGPRRRAWLLLSHLIQTMMVFATAIIQSIYGVQDSGGVQIGCIALLAFSSGAQIASMRPMRVPEITTAMATAAWIDLLVDPNIIAIKNRPRDRRALFLISLVAGSFAGAFMRVNIGSSNALIVSGVGKVLVTITFFLNREQPRAEP